MQARLIHQFNIKTFNLLPLHSLAHIQTFLSSCRCWGSSRFLLISFLNWSLSWAIVLFTCAFFSSASLSILSRSAFCLASSILSDRKLLPQHCKQSYTKVITGRIWLNISTLVSVRKVNEKSVCLCIHVCVSMCALWFLNSCTGIRKV